MARLKDIYKSKIISELTKEFKYKSPMAVPRMEKIVITMGIGRAVQDKKFLELANKSKSNLLSSTLSSSHRCSCLLG